MKKLDEGNFIQWQQHVKLIVKGYKLKGCVDGTLMSPSRFISNCDGNLIRNPNHSLFQQ